MKTLAAILLLSVPGLGQNVVVQMQQVWKLVRGTAVAVPHATITVCSASAGDIPCKPALSRSQADENGNYRLSLAPGYYTVTVTARNFGYSYQVDVHGHDYVGVSPKRYKGRAR